METQRTFLFIILALTAMWLWLTWTEHNSPAPQSVQPAQTQPGDSTKAEVPELPPSLDQPGMVPQGVEQVEAATQKIRVVTDLLDVEIDAAGGDIRQVRLQAYS